MPININSVPTITITPPQEYTPPTDKHSPLKNPLSSEDLEWIQGSVLRPARMAQGPCALTSAGIFTFLNGGGKVLAETFFDEMRQNSIIEKASNMQAKDVIQRLLDHGAKIQVDLYLPENVLPDIGSERGCLYQNENVATKFSDITRVHPFNIDHVRDQLDRMPPGECQMLFIDNRHVIAIARDIDNQLWLFDTALNPNADCDEVKPKFQLPTLLMKKMAFLNTNSEEKYATGPEAQTIINEYLSTISGQPVIVSLNKT